MNNIQELTKVYFKEPHSCERHKSAQVEARVLQGYEVDGSPVIEFYHKGSRYMAGQLKTALYGTIWLVLP